jgi:hypothetical protein
MDVRDHRMQETAHLLHLLDGGFEKGKSVPDLCTRTTLGQPMREGTRMSFNSRAPVLLAVFDVLR